MPEYATPESIMTDRQLYESSQAAFERVSGELAEAVRRAERAEALNQITQQEFRQAGAVRAELATRTKQRDELFDLADKHLTERDAALAVIAYARASLAHDEERDYLERIYATQNALSNSPASALAKVKADAWDEGFTTGNRHDGRRDANPHREKESF